MKLRCTLFVTLLLLCAGSYAQDLNLRWVKALPCAVRRMATDNKGNIYITGNFSGTVDLDPGSGVSNFTAIGTEDPFFAKYDVNGNFVNAWQLNGLFIYAITVDKDNNIVLAGNFTDSLDLDPGPSILSFTSAGLSDIVIAKYDSTGKYLAGGIAGGSKTDRLEGITTDAQGNIWVTGSFTGTASFYYGAAATTLTAGGGVNNANAFIAKYTPNIGVIHALLLRNSGSATSDEGYTLATDAASNLYIGGRYQGTIDLDPGSGTASFTSLGVDGFLARYDSAGVYQWGNKFEGIFYTVAIDGNNDLHVYGTFPDSMDADKGPGKAMLYSVNNFDTWMGKYTSAGAYIRARAFVSNGAYSPEMMVVSASGNAYISGRYPDTLDLNPGGSNGVFISKGGVDGYFAKYDGTGAYAGGMSIGSTGSDRPNGMAIDKSGRLWVSGTFSGSTDFDPGPGVVDITATAATNCYFARYGDTDVVTGIHNITNTAAPIKVYGANHSIIIDLTAQQQVAATIRVVDMTGRTIITAKHDRNDMLRLPLPDVAPQVYAVVVENAGSVTSKKLWVE